MPSAGLVAVYAHGDRGVILYFVRLKLGFVLWDKRTELFLS
ncbi:hypothetical protein [Zymomonas mobilis]